MPDELRFVHGGLGIQQRLVVETILAEGIDGEIAHPKRGQVLEKVRTLTGVYLIVRQSGFHDDPRCRDVRPFHRNAEPRVAAAPPTRTDQHVVLAFLLEAAVRLLDFVGNGRIVRSRIPLGLHIHHVAEVLQDAMAQRVVALEQHLLVGNRIQILVQLRLDIDHRPDLQQVERTRLLLRIERHGKLNLDGTAHLALAVLLHQLQDARQREDIVLQDME